MDPAKTAAGYGRNPTEILMVESGELNGLKNDLLCEFFELAIHAILYHRGLYPPSFFERASKYQIPVWVAVHPTIKKYVENCINGIKPALIMGKISAVMITIRDPVDRIPIERFTFRIYNGKESVEEMGEDAKEIEDASLPVNRNKFLVRFGESMKAFSLRIASCKSYLKPLPPNCTCALQIVTDARTQLGMTDDEEGKRFPWVEVDDREATIADARLQSIRGPTEGVCPLEMFVEEAKNKFESTLKRMQQPIPNDEETMQL